MRFPPEEWTANANGIGSCPAQSTLQDLIGLGACMIDDKLFSNFSYAGSAFGGAVPIPAAGIGVTVLDTPFNPGLQFSAPWAVGPGQGMDSLILYQVNVTPGGRAIQDISVGMGGYGKSGSGVVSVAESAQWPGGIGSLFIYLNGGLLDYDELLVDPTTMGSITVIKDIAVNGNDGIAAVSLVTNRFSEVGGPQEVPEPVTLVLLGSGLLTLGLVGWRRKN